MSKETIYKGLIVDTWTIIGRYRWRVSGLNSKAYGNGLHIGIVQTIGGEPIDQWAFKTLEQARDWAIRICNKFNAFERVGDAVLNRLNRQG